MMRKLCIMFCILVVFSCLAFAQGSPGIPFIRNFTAEDYHAHNRNFDIEIDQNGVIYVANFNGLLYYNHVEWQLLLTPDITRITVVYCDKSNTVWVAGYNFIGKVQQKANGDPYLQSISNLNEPIGEVEEIWEKDGNLKFINNSGNIYKIETDSISFIEHVGEQNLGIGSSDIIDLESLSKDKSSALVLSDITQKESLDDGLIAIVKRGRGLVIADEDGHELYTITETNGLCTNNVVYVAYDGHGTLWGATDNGIFAIAVPSAYSRLTNNEGLTGEVVSVRKLGNELYVGTLNGLFLRQGMRFKHISSIHHACWQIKLAKDHKSLVASTANGAYQIFPGGVVKQLTTANTLCVLLEKAFFYSGEVDGVYFNQWNGSRKKVSSQENITRIYKDREGTIWMKSLYGQIFNKKPTEESFHLVKVGDNPNEMATLIKTKKQIYTIGAESKQPFTYPSYSHSDQNDNLWLTDFEGKHLYVWKDGKRQTQFDKMLFPLGELSISTVYNDSTHAYIGNEKGLYIVDMNAKDPAFKTKPQLFFRSIILNGDSVLWKGIGNHPASLPLLEHKDNNLHFTFSLSHESLIGETLYRYQVNDGAWSIWRETKDASFSNLQYGHYTLRIQARNADGELSDVEEITFVIRAPFYLRWYMEILYLVIVSVVIYAIVRYRLKRLEEEKQNLEHIVQERTAEVVKQKDEIQEKSESLEKALDDLSAAQHQLIQQEKMATVGKLTQGLIDRILNPINYINNFSKLSEGLIKDIEANIEDEKDHMDEENYEDTMDVLNMLTGNLQKVGEHGLSTTRTLKAMEEMLKDRSGGIVKIDLTKVLRQDKEMFASYYAKDITSFAIKTTIDFPAEPVFINANPEQLSKVFMSLLANCVYAVKKKSARKGMLLESYTPEIKLLATIEGELINIKVYDNGIGIENKIINKIFDPFFTTKTTGEATGIGLYLSHEIIQSYKGDIQVASVKDDYTEFTITLPIIKE